MGKMDNNKTSHIAKENIQVEKLLRPKPTAEELDYPKEPIYEPALPDETTAKKRHREQRNIKRKVDWKNQCQVVEDQSPMIDNSKWDKVDNKVKNLIYLSLGTEGTNIFHQRNPQRNQKRNIRQIPIFQMHTEPRRIIRTIPFKDKAKSSTMQLGRLRRQLGKRIFIQGMSSPQIQMDLLSEDRDPLEILHYAITRERGQEIQHWISNTHIVQVDPGST